MKGITMISSVIFLAFIIVAITLVISIGIPILEKMQCAATIDKMKSSFIELDKAIQEVLSGGEGSRRVVDLNIEEGKIYVKDNDDTITWEYTCKHQVLSPRIFKTIGNVIFGTNLDTSAYEDTCLGQDSYVIENKHLKICFRKIGSKDNYTNYNTSQILLGMYQKDLNKWLPLDHMEITIDKNDSSATGSGYTELVREGKNLPYGEVVAYMQPNYDIDYHIRFALESDADFLIIKGEE